MYRMLDIQASGCEAGAQDSTNGHLDGKGEDGSKCSKGKCHRVVGGESKTGVAESCVCIGQHMHKASRQDHTSCIWSKHSVNFLPLMSKDVTVQIFILC